MTVYSKRAGAPVPPEGAILVDRTTVWGNPFPLESDSRELRKASLTRFVHYARTRLVTEPDWLNPLIDWEKLVPRNLVCWCWPKLCHADVLTTLCWLVLERDTGTTRPRVDKVARQIPLC